MKRIGVLCYDLQGFTIDCLNRIQDSIHLRLKAYPLLNRVDSGKKSFEYRTTESNGKFFSVKRTGVVPEGFPLNIDIPLAWSCVIENEVVILFGLQGATAIVTAILARLMGRSLISVNQTMAPEWEVRRSWWVKTLKSFLLSLCHQHIYQTAITKETLEVIYGLNPIAFHYAPFEAGASFFEGILKKEKSKKHNSEKSVNFLFVGTLLKFKGLLDLIRACQRLKQEKYKFDLRILGPEPKQKDELTINDYQKIIREKELNDFIVMVGPCVISDLPKQYYWSDVLVLPTYRDMWPKVLVEAALCERPSITTSACGASGELVINNKTGWVINPGDVDQLVNAMKFVIKNKTLIKKYGKSARKNCLKLCNPKKEVKGYIEAIDAVVDLKSDIKS